MNAQLNDIKSFLENYKFYCEIIPSTEEMPIDQLAITLDPDRENRQRLLVIRSQPQDLAQNDTLLDLQLKEKTYLEMHFISTLPFIVEKNCFDQTARLILLLNKGMELPGFELSEVDSLIFFRHSFLVPEDGLDERILLSLVGMVQIVMDAFYEPLETIATGKASLEEIYEEIARLFK